MADTDRGSIIRGRSLAAVRWATTRVLVPEDGTASAKRRAYGSVLAIAMVLGLASKFYAGPGATWVVGHAGGFFYVLFWVFALLALAPRASPQTAALWVVGITCALELLQLWHPPFLESIRSTFLGHALIGSTFSGWDFVYYGLAGLAAPALARRCRIYSSEWVAVQKTR